eukprot:1161380-Pelagomonas_calceolata.AAC.1
MNTEQPSCCRRKHKFIFKALQSKGKEQKLCRQRSSPCINEGKGDTLDQKSREFPPLEEVKQE